MVRAVCLVALLLSVLPAHAAKGEADQRELRQARDQVIMRAMLMYQMGNRMKARRLYEQAIVEWAENPTPEHEAVCRRYFEILFRRGQLASHRDRLAKCPRALLDVWYATGDRRAIEVYSKGSFVPDSVISKKQCGYAVVAYDIDEQGKTTNITIVEASDKVFEKPARKMIKETRFLPALKDGEPVYVEGVSYRVTYDQCSQKKVEAH